MSIDSKEDQSSAVIAETLLCPPDERPPEPGIDEDVHFYCCCVFNNQ